MSDIDPTQEFAGQTGTLYVAEKGTAFPADVDEAIDTGDWIGLGLVDTDGVKFSFAKNLQYIRSWQRRRATRGLRGDIDETVGFNLQQWNEDTLIESFGGGTVTAGRFVPPAEHEIREVAFLLEALDGIEVVRFGAYRAVNQAATAFDWSRAGESKLPVEFMILDPGSDGGGDDGTDPWFFDSTLLVAGS